MKRKICILTQPLRTNYGGLLQAYALQKVLKDMGHDVITDSYPWRSMPKYRIFLSVCKRICLKFIALQKISHLIPFNPSYHEIKFISKYTDEFISRNIITCDFFKGRSKPNICDISKFDTLIVGSDQVWRKLYSPVYNYFLDFAESNNEIKKIAYAASFGIMEWEFSINETKKLRQLANKFDAISVRENSGKILCKDYLGVEAYHVLDPTMLLEKEDYLNLINEDSITLHNSEGTMMLYILDECRDKVEISDFIASKLNLKPFKVQPNNNLNYYTRSNLSSCVFPRVTQWLKGFDDSEFIVTDSFHGTVFSIIFNKPFITILNQNRGGARFVSLLNLFGLEDRLIRTFDESKIIELLNTPIDFSSISFKLSSLRKESLNFLRSNL